MPPMTEILQQLYFKFESDKNEMIDFGKTFADDLAEENLAEKKTDSFANAEFIKRNGV